MPRLVIEKAEDPTQRGQEIDLIGNGAPNSIGRGADCDLTLNDQRASRVHCTVSLKFGTWYLEDNQSRNGTFCGDARVTRLALGDGDRIRVGSAVMQFSQSDTECMARTREIAGCRPEELLSMTGGVLRLRGWQLALDRPVRVDCIHPRWDCFSASDPCRELVLDAVNEATAAAARLDHPRIAGFLSTTIPDDGGGGHVLMRPAGQVLLTPDLLLKLDTLDRRLDLVRSIAEAYLGRAAYPALRSPIGLDGIGLHPDDGPILPPLELYACLAEARRISVHLPELIPYLPPETIRDCAREAGENDGNREGGDGDDGDGDVDGVHADAAAGRSGDDERSFRKAAYNLGAIAYHVISGSPPMGATDAETVIRNHLRLEPAPLDAIVPDLPESIAELVRHLLAKDPTDRPASAAEILEPLRSASTATRRSTARAEAKEDIDDARGDERAVGTVGTVEESVRPAARRPAAPRQAMASSAAVRSSPSTPRRRRSRPSLVLWLPLCLAFWIALFFVTRWGVARWLIEKFDG